ncbi:MAG TPA: N-acetylmuramoyl-L-alanine amidase [Thermohalobaculum sp.]|nr:N-acetylmuramoyl-L-alanine amidase [Thermohalobaculum sp.]
MAGPLSIDDRPSPNHNARADGARPDIVVLHYTGMESAEAAVGRLVDPDSGVSAHYVLMQDGRVLRLVEEERRAWHAGDSHWGGTDHVNSRSIGIEIVNRGHDFGYEPFPEPQMAALERLLGGLLERWSIPAERVVGHACVAPGRKIDPGEKLDWRRLARGGLSIWVDGARSSPLDQQPEAGRFQRAAARFGYGVPRSGRWDGETRDCWDAFLRRFRPAEVGVPPHVAGVKQLEEMARRWPVRLDAEVAGS